MRCSFSSSSSRRIASFLADVSNSPASLRRSRSSMRRTRVRIVTKLVSVPPIQRWLTYGMPGAGGLFLDGVLSLLLGADEEHRSCRRRPAGGRSHRLVEATDGLLQVDDVDAVALGEDERAHTRVPAAGLVAEVDAGFEQRLHLYRCRHWLCLENLRFVLPGQHRDARAGHGDCALARCGVETNDYSFRRTDPSDR